jgi:hypothetical protein
MIRTMIIPTLGRKGKLAEILVRESPDRKAWAPRRKSTMSDLGARSLVRRIRLVKSEEKFEPDGSRLLSSLFQDLFDIVQADPLFSK